VDDPGEVRRGCEGAVTGWSHSGRRATRCSCSATRKHALLADQPGRESCRAAKHQRQQQHVAQNSYYLWCAHPAGGDGD
jgi:hypothetical protein